MDSSRGPLTRYGFTRERLAWIAMLCISLTALPLYTWAKVRTVDADDLSFLCLARDLFGSAYRVTDWCWCHSLYLLPDQLLFLPLARLFTNPLHAYYLHSILLFVLQIAACALLYSRLAGDRRDLLAFVSLQSLVLLFLVFGQRQFPHQALSWIGWHGGVLISGVLYLVLSLDASRVSRAFPSLLAAVCGLSFLSTLSDRLFLVQFAIPGAVAWSCLAWRRQTPPARALLLILLPLGACVLAMLAQKWLIKLGLYHASALPVVTWRDRWNGFFTLLGILWQMRRFVPYSLLVLGMALAVCAWRLRRAGRFSPRDDHQVTAVGLSWTWLSLFFPWCVLGSFLAPVYTGLLHGYDSSRFFFTLAIPGSLLPIAAWLSRPRPDSANRWLSLAPCCVLAFLVFRTLAPLPGVVSSFRKERLDIRDWGQARSLAKALAAHDLRCGYAGFWETKVLSVAYPDHRASQLAPGGNLLPWLTNLDYYFTDRCPELGRGIPCYEYLFLSQRGAISLGRKHPFWERFGPPAAVVESGPDTVLVYNRPADVGFRNFLRLPCLVQAKRPLPVSSTCQELRTYIRPGTSPLDALVVQSQLHQAHLFPLERPMPVAGHVLELSLDDNDEYEVTFLHQQVEVGKTRLRTAAPRQLPGLNPFFLLIEDHVPASTVDAVQVKPVGGDGRFAVGHLFVYPDSRVSPRERESPSGRDGQGVAKSGVP